MVTVIPGGGGGMIWISSDRDDPRIFWGRKVLASIFLGIQNLCLSFHVISFKVFWKFLCLGNSARDFWGLKFWSRDFWGVSLEALGIFFWFWFLPPFNHPHLLKSGVPPWYIFFLFHFLEEHFLLHVRYMADSVAREDKANSVFWLATQAGKMAMVQHEKSYLCNIIKSFSDQGFLVKMARHACIWPAFVFTDIDYPSQ